MCCTSLNTLTQANGKLGLLANNNLVCPICIFVCYQLDSAVYNISSQFIKYTGWWFAAENVGTWYILYP